MSIEHTVDRLINEVNGPNRKDVVDCLEETLGENIEELSKNKRFFQLPLKNIFSVILRVDFDTVDENENDDKFDVLQNIIENTIHSHDEEKEKLLILQDIDVTKIPLSYEKSHFIFESFQDSPLFQRFHYLHAEKQQLPEIDFEYEQNEKNMKIEALKQTIKELKKIDFPPISEKPTDYISDIFLACEKGNLPSVQWLIEKESVNKNKEYKTVDYDFRKCDMEIIRDMNIYRRMKTISTHKKIYDY